MIKLTELPQEQEAKKLRVVDFDYTITTTKSKTFQADFRYVWGPNMNPCEVMDIPISTANIVVNTTSETSKNLRAVESSGTEGPSAARIKEFNMIARRMKL